MRAQRWFGFVLVVVLLGCGRYGEFPTAQVSGKVTYEGQPVTGGAITLAPQATSGDPGKAAMGIVQPDGTFRLTTYQEGDGAVIGKHSVTFAAPAGELPPGKTEWEPGEEPTKSKYAGLAPKPAEVEIKKGANEITVELAKGGSP